MIVKIGNKEVKITDYFSANQVQKALYETYKQGYQDGGADMEQAKQIIIDSLLKQIEQIRADAFDEIHTELITEIALLNETDMTDVDLYAFAVRIKEITDKLVMK